LTTSVGELQNRVRAARTDRPSPCDWAGRGMASRYSRRGRGDQIAMAHPVLLAVWECVEPRGAAGHVGRRVRSVLAFCSLFSHSSPPSWAIKKKLLAVADAKEAPCWGSQNAGSMVGLAGFVTLEGPHRRLSRRGRSAVRWPGFTGPYFRQTRATPHELFCDENDGTGRLPSRTMTCDGTSYYDNQFCSARRPSAQPSFFFDYYEAIA